MIILKIVPTGDHIYIYIYIYIYLYIYMDYKGILLHRNQALL